MEEEEEVQQFQCVTDVASPAIGQCGGVRAIVTTMKTFNHQVDVVTACCNALWTLAVCGGLFSPLCFNLVVFKVILQSVRGSQY